MNEDLINKIIRSYQVFNPIYGTVFNTLVCVVCLRKNLRSVPSFIFMAFIAILDILPLHIVNLYAYIWELSGSGLDSPFWCTIAVATNNFVTIIIMAVCYVYL